MNGTVSRHCPHSISVNGPSTFPITRLEISLLSILTTQNLQRFNVSSSSVSQVRAAGLLGTLPSGQDVVIPQAVSVSILARL